MLAALLHHTQTSGRVSPTLTYLPFIAAILLLLTLHNLLTGAFTQIIRSHTTQNFFTSLSSSSSSTLADNPADSATSSVVVWSFCSGSLSLMVVHIADEITIKTQHRLSFGLLREHEAPASVTHASSIHHVMDGGNPGHSGTPQPSCCPTLCASCAGAVLICPMHVLLPPF